MAELETEIRHAFERRLAARPPSPDLPARISGAVLARSSRLQAWRVVAASAAFLLVGAASFYVLLARHTQPAPIIGPTPSVQSPTPTVASPTPSPTASPTSPSSSPSAVASPGVIANCPARISNVSGAYSFTCPPGWKYVNCEQSRFVDLYTWLINPQGCSPEPYTLRMMVWSRPGDQPFGVNSYLGQQQSSQPVTVAGVSGERRTYLVTADNSIPPPKGTVQVEYRFLTGGRSYFALYDRYPGDTDLTAAFDQMVTTSLTFSSG